MPFSPQLANLVVTKRSTAIMLLLHMHSYHITEDLNYVKIHFLGNLSVLLNICDSLTLMIASFIRIVYPLKYPSIACLSCLDNGSCLQSECSLFTVSNVIGVLISKQVA